MRRELEERGGETGVQIAQSLQVVNHWIPRTRRDRNRTVKVAQHAGGEDHIELARCTRSQSAAAGIGADAGDRPVRARGQREIQRAGGGVGCHYSLGQAGEAQRRTVKEQVGWTEAERQGRAAGAVTAEAGDLRQESGAAHDERSVNRAALGGTQRHRDRAAAVSRQSAGARIGSRSHDVIVAGGGESETLRAAQLVNYRNGLWIAGISDRCSGELHTHGRNRHGELAASGERNDQVVGGNAAGESELSVNGTREGRREHNGDGAGPQRGQRRAAGGGHRIIGAGDDTVKLQRQIALVGEGQGLRRAAVSDLNVAEIQFVGRSAHDRGWTLIQKHGYIPAGKIRRQDVGFTVAIDIGGGHGEGSDPHFVVDRSLERAIAVALQYPDQIEEALRHHQIGNAIGGNVGHRDAQEPGVGDGVSGLRLERAIIIGQQDTDGAVVLVGDDEIGIVIAVHVGNGDCGRTVAHGVVDARGESAVPLAQKDGNVGRAEIGHHDVGEAVVVEVGGCDRDRVRADGNIDGWVEGSGLGVEQHADVIGGAVAVTMSG